MPKTKLGKGSLICIGLFFILLVIVQLIVASGQTGGETFFDNLYISIPMFLAGIAGVLSFVLGIIGIIKSKERSALVFISSLIGLLILVFAVGEFLGPAH